MGVCVSTSENSESSSVWSNDLVATNDDDKENELSCSPSPVILPVSKALAFSPSKLSALVDSPRRPVDSAVGIKQTSASPVVIIITQATPPPTPPSKSVSSSLSLSVAEPIPECIGETRTTGMIADINEDDESSLSTYKVEDSTIWDNLHESEQNKYFVIGIICLDYQYMAQIGDIDYENSLNYKIKQRYVNNLTFEFVQKGNKLTKQMKYDICNILKEFLSMKRIVCITGNCGFMMNYQKDIITLAKQLVYNKSNCVYKKSVPIVMSSLMLCPIILFPFQSQDKILILTANSSSLTPQVLYKWLRNYCNINKKCDMNRFIIRGGENVTGFGFEIQKGEKINLKIAKIDFVKLVKNVIIESNDRIAAILLECTQMPVFANPLRKEFNLPVFDILSLANFYHAGMASNLTVKHDFEGAREGNRDNMKGGDQHVHDRVTQIPEMCD